jgi:selenide,water dikinase
MGLVPAGAYRNREFREKTVDFGASVERNVQDVLFDPQTSGGLLISVDATHAQDLLRALKEKGVQDAAMVGEVIAEPKEKILVE